MGRKCGVAQLMVQSERRASSGSLMALMARYMRPDRTVIACAHRRGYK